MERSNGNDFVQHIMTNGTGHQNYYSGRDHQIIAGSGTIHNYSAAYPNSDYSREKIMQALHTSPYLQRKNRNPDRVPGTCEWFMNHHDFHHWRDSMSSSMLWVSANPGCGKSVLAKYLVNELKSTEERTTCYFFFKDDFEDQRTARGALSCILHQLFIQRENLLSAEIIQRFRSYKAPLASSYYELWELWDILAMATQEKNAGEIICILDAFDECANQERQDLAKILREFYRPRGDTKGTVNLKFLITSRPYDTIRQDLIRPFDIQECPVIHLKGDGDAEVEKIASEISLYIKDRVSRIRSNLSLTQKEEKILLEELGAIRNQTYLWVFLTLEWIETEINNKVNEIEIRKVTSTLPRTVDEAYQKILSKSTDVGETKKLLHIVVAAERPLTLAEMELALAIQQHHNSYKGLILRPIDRVRNYIRDLCGLFINITDERIYLLHQTAKEFLVPSNNLYSEEYSLAQREDVSLKDHRNGLTWKFSLMPSKSHGILCKICIWHLLFTEFENLPPTGPAHAPNYLRDHLFLEYSAKHWATHFRASNITEKEILQELKRLCNATSDGCPAWFKIYWASIYNNFPLEFTTLMIASYFGIETIVRLQIETNDVEIDSKDGLHHRTALSFASENGFDSVVRLLIKGPKFYWKRALKNAIRLSFTKGADVNKGDIDGRTALIYAVWNGHLSIVKRLLKARALVDMVDTIGGTPISYALCYGQEDIATKLMRGAQPDSIDEIRHELLLSAVKHGHHPVVKRLLDSGADPGATDDEGISLVVLATKQGKTSIVELLIERGADINNGGRDGETPLMLAIDQGETNVIELLIEKGADVNKSDCNGKTPLVLAIEKGGGTYITELLIKRGADINNGDRDGKIPLTFAMQNSRPTRLHLVELLLKSGAKVDYTFAASNIHTYALQLILVSEYSSCIYC
ncbi:ankyrin repeat-containing domain protein [Trichoderma sp. SZMC 28012]